MYLAHGLGGGSDLPLPASYAVLGGTAALLVSFVVLALAWRKPRYEAQAPGRPAPTLVARVADAPRFALALRSMGMVALAFSVWCVVAGPDDVAVNPVFGIVYVLLWVGLVPASLLAGPVVRALSPARTIHALLARAVPAERRLGFVSLPAAVGYWPAAIGLLAFAWIELVSPAGTTLPVLATWFLAYFVVMIGGALLFGAAWFERADPFEVYSTLVAHLSVWSRDSSGALVMVSPLRNLGRVAVRPGLVGVVGVLLGSTAFDSYRDSTPWLRFTQDNPERVVLLETLLLLGVTAAVIAVFATATALPGYVDGVPRRRAPSLLAHSVVPIVLGYMAAHYLTLLVETGQRTFVQMSDPLGAGWNLFGTADLQVSLWLSLHPTLLATIKVAVIVLGHVVGVIAAHDRALALLPHRARLAGQLPLLVVMLGFTFGGLYLLFGL